MTNIRVTLAANQAVALRGDERLATMTYRQSRWHLHPGEYFCRFAFEQHVAPKAHEALAQQLYQTALPHMLEEGVLLLRIGADEDDAFLPVLRRLGFRTYCHVFTPVLDLKTFDVKTLEPLEVEAAALGFEITTLAALGTGDDIVTRFRALHDEVYSEGSGAIPATPHLYSLDEWREQILDEDFLTDGCFIAVKDGAFAAFVNLYVADLVPENRGVELDTASFGTSRAYREHHRPVVFALWAQCVRYAQSHDYQSIRAEIDSDYPWILDVCAELPMSLGKDYVSLVRAVRWQVL